MSKYTTEVRYICEHYAGLTESAGYNNVAEVIENSRTKIFNFDFPIFDESYRSVLETKILKHYYTREIGAETVGLWQLWLDTKMNEIMPFYNRLYESELIKFDPMRDYMLDKEGGKKAKGNSTDSGSDVNTNVSGGSDRTVDVTSGNNTANTANSGSDVTNTASAPKSDRWDLYSDTPQGGLTGMRADENKYLTNARHVIEDGTGSTEQATTTHGLQIESTGEYSDESTATTTYGRTVTDTVEHGKITDFENTEDYFESISGKISGVSYSKLLMEFRDTFINIDMMIIDELKDLFFNLW